MSKEVFKLTMLANYIGSVSTTILRY